MANLLGLDADRVVQQGPEILPVLGGIYAYRSLDRQKKDLVMREVDRVKENDPQLHGRMVATVGDIIANARGWNLPSLTDQELKQAIKDTKTFLSVLDWVERAVGAGMFAGGERFPRAGQTLSRGSMALSAALLLFRLEEEGELTTLRRERRERRERQVPQWP
jgi:hypothetical protein